MHIHVAVERLTGALLLALVILVPISTAISGYDTARDGWDVELRRLGSMEHWQIRLNVLFQTLAGLGLIAAAGGVYLTLQRRARILAAFSAVMMGAAGGLIRAASATYQALAELGSNFVAGLGAEQVLVSSRAFAVAVDGLVQKVVLLLALSLYLLAVIVYRHSMIPRWIAVLAVLSLVLVLVSGIIESVSGADGGWWLFLMGGLGMMWLWLLVAGVTLLLGYRPMAVANPNVQPE